MATPLQPACGPFPAVEGPALSRTWEWVVAAGGVIGGVVGALAYSEKVIGGVQWIAGIAGTSSGIALAAVAGAALGFAIGLAIVFSKGLDRTKARPGVPRCYSGVVNGIALAYGSPEHWAFPWAAQHDRVDVVVKRAYWPLISATPAVYAYCATDVRMSPLIRSYFFSRQVKNGAEGAMAAAVVGGIGAAVVGYFAGVGIAAAIGTAACSASLIFYLLCLLVVIVVALLVALVLTLISAFAGGAISAGATGGGGGPSTGGASAPVAIALGQYITLNANLAIYGEDNDAWVAWWVDVTTATATPVLHGVSMSGEGPVGGAPFNFPDADGGFTDACPV